MLQIHTSIYDQWRWSQRGAGLGTANPTWQQNPGQAKLSMPVVDNNHTAVNRDAPVAIAPEPQDGVVADRKDLCGIPTFWQRFLNARKVKFRVVLLKRGERLLPTNMLNAYLCATLNSKLFLTTVLITLLFWHYNCTESLSSF